MTSDSELIEFIQTQIDGKHIEQQCGSRWLDFNGRWDGNAVYRVKPKPMEGWVNIYIDPRNPPHISSIGKLHCRREDAIAVRGSGGKTIKFMEVLDDN